VKEEFGDVRDEFRDDVSDGPRGGACPRCGAARLRAWAELTEAEREVVRRLPASADAPLAERAAGRRWCTRCWHEAADAPRTA
jgi:hypothetical protein